MDLVDEYFASREKIRNLFGKKKYEKEILIEDLRKWLWRINLKENFIKYYRVDWDIKMSNLFFGSLNGKRINPIQQIGNYTLVLLYSYINNQKRILIFKNDKEIKM